MKFEYNMDEDEFNALYPGDGIREIVVRLTDSVVRFLRCRTLPPETTVHITHCQVHGDGDDYPVWRGVCSVPDDVAYPQTQAGYDEWHSMHQAVQARILHLRQDLDAKANQILHGKFQEMNGQLDQQALLANSQPAIASAMVLDAIERELASVPFPPVVGRIPGTASSPAGLPGGVLKMGTWSVHSVSDPRWNRSARGAGLVCQGGPQQMKDWISQCRAKYGDPPADTIMEFMKD